jgi:hypothetical protein
MDRSASAHYHWAAGIIQAAATDEDIKAVVMKVSAQYFRRLANAG